MDEITYRIWTVVLKPRYALNTTIRVTISGLISLNETGATMMAWMLIGEGLEQAYIIDSVSSVPFERKT